MRTQVFGIGAGLLVSACAFAADDVAVPTPVVQQVPMECYAGSIRPASTYAAGLVFDNSVGANTTNGANPALAMDDVCLAPGNGVAGPQLITGMAFGFAIRGTTGSTRSFDALVEFVDSYNSAAPAGTPAWTGTLGTVVRVQFVNLNQNAAYTTAMLDLSGLPGGGIQTFDPGFGLSIKFVEPGTNDIITSASVQVTHLITTNFTTAGTNELVNGSDSFVYWRDADLNGQIEVSDLRNFTWPLQARFWLKLQGQVKCPADFNGDGQADFFDYLDFVGAFDTGCE